MIGITKGREKYYNISGRNFALLDEEEEKSVINGHFRILLKSDVRMMLCSD